MIGPPPPHMQSQAYHHPKRPAACHQGHQVKDGTALQGAGGPRITCSCTHAGPRQGATLWAGAGKRSFVHKQRHRRCPQAPGPEPWSTPWHPPIPCQLTPMGPLVPIPPLPPIISLDILGTVWAHEGGQNHPGSQAQAPHCLLPTPAAAVRSPPASSFSQHLKQLKVSTPFPQKSLGPAWAEGLAGPHRLVCGQGCGLQERRSAGRGWGWHRCSG